jgi:hypothetical protein
LCLSEYLNSTGYYQAFFASLIARSPSKTATSCSMACAGFGLSGFALALLTASFLDRANNASEHTHTHTHTHTLTRQHTVHANMGKLRAGEDGKDSSQQKQPQAKHLPYAQAPITPKQVRSLASMSWADPIFSSLVFLQSC